MCSQWIRLLGMSSGDWPRGLDCFLLAREFFKQQDRISADGCARSRSQSDRDVRSRLLRRLALSSAPSAARIGKDQERDSGPAHPGDARADPGAARERTADDDLSRATTKRFGSDLQYSGYATQAWVQPRWRSAGFARHQFVYTPSFRWWKKFVALATNNPQSGRLIAHAFANERIGCGRCGCARQHRREAGAAGGPMGASPSSLRYDPVVGAS